MHRKEEKHQSVEIINKEFSDFLLHLSDFYADRKPRYLEEIKKYLDSVILLPHQFIYVHQIKTGDFYHKGFNDCLGYDIEHLTADFFIRNLHEADLPLYFKISKALLSFVMDNGKDLVPFQSSFQMNYRLKNSEGAYVQVLRQSTPFIKNENGRIEAYISICSDVTNISSSNSVKWDIGGPKKELFNDYLHGGETEHLFSGRELDVLKLLSLGHSSPKISEELFISINTVNTHRKSLMRKANVNKTIDLISFGVENGYL